MKGLLPLESLTRLGLDENSRQADNKVDGMGKAVAGEKGKQTKSEREC